MSDEIVHASDFALGLRIQFPMTEAFIAALATDGGELVPDVDDNDRTKVREYRKQLRDIDSEIKPFVEGF